MSFVVILLHIFKLQFESTHILIYDDSTGNANTAALASNNMPVPPSGTSSSGNIATVTNNVTKAQVTTKPINTTTTSYAPPSSSSTQSSSTNCHKNSLNFESNNGTQNGPKELNSGQSINCTKGVSTVTNTKSEVRCKLCSS